MINTMSTGEKWREVKAGDIFGFVRSHAFSRDNLVNGLIDSGHVGNIHYGDIHSTYNSPSINLEKISIPLIKDLDFDPAKDDLLIDGDLAMADASEDYEGVGVTVLVDGIGNNKVVGGLHTFVLRDKEGLTNKYYRQYIFRNPLVRNKLQKIANGVSVYGISKTAVSKIVLPIPPIQEQNRIVAVLEAWDGAIERLAKKIEIKKNIKKGLMQRLLTGKLRLSGFSEAWQVVKLKNVCTIQKGVQLNKNNMVADGSYPALNGGVLASGYTNKYNTEASTITISEGGNSCGFVNFSKNKFWCGGHCYAVKPRNGIDNLFLYQILKSKQDVIMALRVGSGLPNIQKKSLDDLKIKMPESIKEQNAIANILVVADYEVEALESQLRIIKDQKKYLLNNLITGTIRTPETLTINV